MNMQGVCMIFMVLYFYFFHLFRATPAASGEGSDLSYSRWPTPQPQQCWIRAVTATYTAAHSHTGSFNPLSEARDPTCILIDPSWFFTAEPWWELLWFYFFPHFLLFFKKDLLPSFLPFLLFRAAPAAYGSSQARGWIRAAAASLHHSHSDARAQLSRWPTPQLRATPDT